MSYFLLFCITILWKSFYIILIYTVYTHTFLYLSCVYLLSEDLRTFILTQRQNRFCPTRLSFWPTKRWSRESSESLRSTIEEHAFSRFDRKIQKYAAHSSSIQLSTVRKFGVLSRSDGRGLLTLLIKSQMNDISDAIISYRCYCDGYYVSRGARAFSLVLLSVSLSLSFSLYSAPPRWNCIRCAVFTSPLGFLFPYGVITHLIKQNTIDQQYFHQKLDIIDHANQYRPNPASRTPKRSSEIIFYDILRNLKVFYVTQRDQLFI